MNLLLSTDFDSKIAFIIKNEILTIKTYNDACIVNKIFSTLKY